MPLVAPISATAVSDAYAYFGRMQVCIQQGFKFPAICDAAPAKNLRCELAKVEPAMAFFRVSWEKWD